jgi:hypothetical protein
MDITEKTWWIAINGESEGTYSYLDLEKDDRVSLKTPVWKEGWEKWKKIEEVEELKDIFRKDSPDIEELEVEPVVPEEEISATESIPPWIFFWVIAIILCIAYLWQLFRT